MMFILKIAKFAPVWTTIFKIWAIFVHQTLTEHGLCLKGVISINYISEAS